ncbi:acyl-CoA N-acyltransferase [Xylariaceae sp. FL1651]|nr:acyl-CoA N-acyltransferase [Xylariaceae sp. FL1651]
MAPQKRKRPHDAGLEAPKQSLVPMRRPTRQHPSAAITSVEPEHQLRSGRARAITIEKSSDMAIEHAAPRAKNDDALRAANSDSAVVMRQTRTSRLRGTVDSEAAAVSSTSQGNANAPILPSVKLKRVSLPKQTRHVVHNHLPPQTMPQPSPPSHSRPPVSKPSLQSTRPIPAANGSGPAPTAAAAIVTPKRSLSNKIITPKPPGTPRSDRNIDKVVFGNICFKAWYPSYYGKEVLGDVSGNAGAGNAKIGGGKRDPPILDRLYVCPCCFKYSKEMVPVWKHIQFCEKSAFIPGKKIYTHPRSSRTARVPQMDLAATDAAATAKGKEKQGTDEDDQAVEGVVDNQGEWSVWEVDGEEAGLFCQNLSLFAKLFLDNKSVFFDVTGFNYFLLVYTPPPSKTHTTSPEQPGSAPPWPAKSDNSHPPTIDPQASASTSLPQSPRPQIVGFFSKEKMSWDNNNLACILVFPPWQRKGLGALLMGVSYEISRREGLLGGPEKPISELGRKGYKRFWAGEITRWILEQELPVPPADSTSVTRHTRREKEKEKDTNREHESVLVDLEQCSRDTWIVPEDCLAVLRDMGLVEEAGLGPPRGEQDGDGDEDADAVHPTTGKEKDEKEPKVPLVLRVRVDKAAVRAWARENKIELTRTCDPNGFIEGYAIRKAEAEDKEG